MEKYNSGRRQILMALASLAGGLFLPGTGHAAPQTQEAQRMLVVFYCPTQGGVKPPPLEDVRHVF